MVPGSSLVPAGDTTLLFTSAGMVQFKRNWATEIPLDYTRAATCQKCLRAGGKDSDLEKIGTSGRHHTFFEMLGNFSFGDYFKEEAISWAWEFVTKVLGIPAEKLWVSYFEDDEETRAVWLRFFPAERVVPLGARDNFWGPAGDSGPCGPCTEIYLDNGNEAGCGEPDCKPGCDCDRFIEFWNLVFPQFDQQPDGSRLPLKRRGVDTGMGLERVARILQGTRTNYETDLFAPLLDVIARKTQAAYGDSETQPSFRIIADHTRAAVFLVDDGVFPSNEGRGYVLRRIIRRACLAALRLNARPPFLPAVGDAVTEVMSPTYPSLRDHAGIIGRVLAEEEARFSEIIGTARKLFDDLAGESDTGQIPGEVAFRLYDTYGIPRDLIEELAEDRGRGIDWDGFSRLLAKQQEKSRAGSSFADQRTVVFEQEGMRGTVFTGYDSLSAECRVVALYRGKKGEMQLVTDRTPFYAERGGQIGDRGTIEGAGFLLQVADTQYDEKGFVYHIGRFQKGSAEAVREGAPAVARVDAEFRKDVAANHSATHLLHWALRRVVGPEVRQAGSLVSAERLRFDFISFSELTEEMVRAVEQEVRTAIFRDLPVSTSEMTLEEARAAGAVALFVDRYGEKVRVVRSGDLHAEVCGGTHVERTGHILGFKITGVSSIGRNLKRIEAITRRAVFRYLDRLEDSIGTACTLLGASRDQWVTRLEKLIEQSARREEMLSRYQQMAIAGEAQRLQRDARAIAGGRLIVAETAFADPEAVGKVADMLVEGDPGTVAVLGAVAGDRLLVVIKTGKAASERMPASTIMKKISPVIGGGGGGNAFFAQGSGRKADAFPEVARTVHEMAGLA